MSEINQPYTPTTDEVRDMYAEGEWDIYPEVDETPRREAFDRWLAEHDRQVAERAWDEGAKAQADAYGMEVDTGPSPYRAAKGEQK